MASDATFESDKGIGLAIVLGALAVGGALMMLGTVATPGTLLAAYGFAAAVVAGALAVVALHVYE